MYCPKKKLYSQQSHIYMIILLPSFPSPSLSLLSSLPSPSLLPPLSSSLPSPHLPPFSSPPFPLLSSLPSPPLTSLPSPLLPTPLLAIFTLQKKLDLSPRIEEILKSSPLVGSTKISDCTKAARDLQKAMNEEFSQGVPILQAVTEQKQRFSALSFEFCNRLSNHLCGLFTTKVHVYSVCMGWGGGGGGGVFILLKVYMYYVVISRGLLNAGDCCVCMGLTGGGVWG